MGRDRGARVIQADERGIKLDRTVFTRPAAANPGDTRDLGVSQWSTPPRVGWQTSNPHPRLGAARTWRRTRGRDRLAPPISAVAYPHSLHLLCSIVPGAATGGQVADRRGRLDSDVLESSLDREVIASRLNVLVAEARPVKSRWITGG